MAWGVDSDEAGKGGGGGGKNLMGSDRNWMGKWANATSSRRCDGWDAKFKIKISLPNGGRGGGGRVLEISLSNRSAVGQAGGTK